MLHTPKRNEIMRRRQVSALLPLLCIKSQLGRGVRVGGGTNKTVLRQKVQGRLVPPDPSEGPPPPVAGDLQHGDGGHLTRNRVTSAAHLG